MLEAALASTWPYTFDRLLAVFAIMAPCFFFWLKNVRSLPQTVYFAFTAKSPTLSGEPAYPSAIDFLSLLPSLTDPSPVTGGFL